MSTPLVPPRPSRANGTAATINDTTPQVPARPVRKTDPSPIREARSPLNELPDPMGGSFHKRPPSATLAPSDIPPRPPSVSSFPSIGQEGSEYANVGIVAPEVPGVNNVANSNSVATPEQTRNVAHDMPLHAPKASVPQSTAKSRIETVTGTDSTQAAAAGIGKAKPDDDVHKTPADSSDSLVPPQGDELKRVVTEPAPLRQKPSFTRPVSGLAHHSSRPASIYDDEHQHGIPEIGKQIPLNPNAGDVQAPSPAPALSQHTPGVGFFNDGSARAHQRRKSGRHEYGPPGSYGLHSHSQEPHDRFERDWYARNPDKALAEGHNVYGRPRPETALSSAELNRIVTQSDDVGMGTDANTIGTPGEEIGYSASDAYVARRSPRPSPIPTQGRGKRASSGSQPAVESPLRRTSYPWHGVDHAVATDDDAVIHVDAPEYRTSKITGGGPVDGAVDLGPHAGNTAEEGGWFIERGAGTPILASDEVLKRHESAYMQAAVNPHDDYDSDYSHENSRPSSMRIPSRPTSRPNSTHGDYHGGNLHRFISHDDPHHGSSVHTPLEEIEEYEPLIPEGEQSSPARKVKAKDARKRPGLEHHHFPSQDIWEDTPSSLQFSTTVQTPDVSSERNAAASALFETPQQEQMRKLQNPADMTSDEKTLLKPHYASRERPGAQRFPSKDIWEDTPSSLQYETTVGGPQMDDARSPPEDRPTTSAIPGSQDDNDARATTGMGQVMRPTIPARPKHRSKLAEEMKPSDVPESQEGASRHISDDQPPSPEKAKAPPIPDRPKPTVPARPARTSRTEQGDASGAALSKSISPEDSSLADAAPSLPTKTKPAVPARPGGEKLAALKAGFMNDLNNRLKIGPQPAKTKEIEPEAADETEKAPLADARKGRAKGPARRKPAASASAAAAEGKPHSFAMSSMLTMWSIDESEELQVPDSSADVAATAEHDTTSPVLEKALAANTASNTEEDHEATPDVLEKVLDANTAANTEGSALGEPMSPEKALSPPLPDATESLARTISPEELKNASPEEHKSIQENLRSSLADIGAAPAVASSTATAADETVGSAFVEEKGSIPSLSAETETTSADLAVQEESAAAKEHEVTEKAHL